MGTDIFETQAFMVFNIAEVTAGIVFIEHVLMFLHCECNSYY